MKLNAGNQQRISGNPKVDSFKRAVKIDKFLVRLTRNKREKKQIICITNGRGIITEPKDIKRIIEEGCEQLCASKFGKIGRMDQFLEIHNAAKFTEEVDDLTRYIH